MHTAVLVHMTQQASAAAAATRADVAAAAMVAEDAVELLTELLQQRHCWCRGSGAFSCKL
jgi:hypothetical protein